MMLRLSNKKAKKGEASRKKSLIRDLKILMERKKLYDEDFERTGTSCKQTDAEKIRLNICLQETIEELLKILEN